MIFGPVPHGQTEVYVHAYTLHQRPTAKSRKEDSFTEPGLGDPEGEFPSKWLYGKDQLNVFLASDLDLLVIILPQTRDMCGILDREQFALFSKRRAYSSKIRGAALDVTDPEPLPADHKLWKYNNFTITPHCAGNSNHYTERVLKILAYNLVRRAQNKEVVNRVKSL
ncbi:NAD(P)-binding domain [Penicillium roqueforti FM164]|uniref:NAD(P)-binding domain n=1 Tax=Penicillium roqueforti (strain FM164) TaxID=1365484 RepID=W6QJ51_PENRF|nr:NAD(P)-binding domain [Penicillium roqueforti FM164]